MPKIVSCIKKMTGVAETERFVKETKQGAKHDQNIGLLVALFLFVVLVSVIADILANFYYGATFVNKNELSFGKLATLFAYTMLGSFGVVSIQGTMQGEEKCVAAGARILAVAEHIPTIPFDGGEIIEDFKGEIEFQNVSLNLNETFFCLNFDDNSTFPEKVTNWN